MSNRFRYGLAALLVLAVMNVLASPPDRDEAENIVRSFLNCWQTGDPDTFAALAHENIEFSYPGGRLDKQRLMSMFRDYHEKKRDIKIYHWDVFLLQEDRFATAYQFAATDRQTDKRQAVGTGVVGRIKDGRIIMFKEYYDEEVATLQYQGKLPLDEGKVSPWPASIWLRPDTID